MKKIISILSILLIACFALTSCGSFSTAEDGKIIKKNLKKIEKDEDWLYNILKSQHITNLKSVLLCMLDEYDKILIQKKYE